ncbi:hypothetical protein CspHIS471_0306960 [Cutaneotrichosporon sp. HIS471]|nr:hypothetical protein CspHIS471_0306960 [Cutaneotrichosporon sp. HIS471]
MDALIQFTTSGSLVDLVDKKVLVMLRDGRKLIGVLRSYDQFANFLLESTVERLHLGHEFADVDIGNFDARLNLTPGVLLIRGENVVALGEIDLIAEDELPLRQIPEDEMKAKIKEFEVGLQETGVDISVDENGTMPSRTESWRRLGTSDDDERMQGPQATIEDITRQFREMRAQRDAALKQNENLRSEVAMLQASANRYVQAQRGYDNPPMDEPIPEPPLANDPFERSRGRPYAIRPGDEMDPFSQPGTDQELRHRPGTAMPQMSHLYQDEDEGMQSGMVHASRAPPRARSAAPYGAGGVRNNLNQFRYREAPAGGPMPLAQPPRPSFTLADPGRRHQRPISAQQDFISQSRNVISAPARFDNMDTINEMGEEIDPFQI